MKKHTFSGLLLVVFIITNPFTGRLYGQIWNPQQKEIWTNVETYWSVQAKGDVEGFLSYFSPDYMGWDYDSPVPMGKAATAKYITNGMKNSKVLFYNITPVAILVYGEVAIVDYYYTIQSENSEAKKQWKNGRWTDILQKQGNKWVLIADHGGEEKSKN